VDTDTDNGFVLILDATTHVCSTFTALAYLSGIWLCLWLLSPYVDKPRCLWCMASATSDLRLPTELTLVPNLYCLVTVGCRAYEPEFTWPNFAHRPRFEPRLIRPVSTYLASSHTRYCYAKYTTGNLACTLNQSQHTSVESVHTWRITDMLWRTIIHF